MNIGCHVSIAGGVFNAPGRAAELGCECFQMFSRSPQGGKAPELSDEVVAKWKAALKESGIANVYIHTPYYINFASSNNRIRHGSASVVRDELERATRLGVRYVMTHLGSAKDIGEEAATEKTIAMLTQALDGYDGTAQLLIENAAGAGAIIGDTFSEIKTIIDGVGSPHIAGICLDTQHAFASGYDWHNFKDTLARIDDELGINHIKLMHANDSKVELGAKRDRHEHIGVGYIGEDAFENIVVFAQENDIDMVLETQHDKVKEDIALLKEMRARITR